MNTQTNIFKAEDDSAFSFLERLKKLADIRKMDWFLLKLEKSK